MTEQLFSMIFNYIYIPFTSALILVSAFFWNLHRKNRNDIDTVATKREVEMLIDYKLDSIRSRQSDTITTLAEISERLEKGNELMGRLDERLKAVDKRLDDKVQSIESQINNR